MSYGAEVAVCSETNIEHQYIVGRAYDSWILKNVGTSREQQALEG